MQSASLGKASFIQRVGWGCPMPPSLSLTCCQWHPDGISWQGQRHSEAGWGCSGAPHLWRPGRPPRTAAAAADRCPGHALCHHTGPWRSPSLSPGAAECTLKHHPSWLTPVTQHHHTLLFSVPCGETLHLVYPVEKHCIWCTLWRNTAFGVPCGETLHLVYPVEKHCIRCTLWRNTAFGVPCGETLHSVYPVEKHCIWCTLWRNTAFGVPCGKTLHLVYPVEKHCIWCTLWKNTAFSVPCGKTLHSVYPVEKHCIWCTLRKNTAFSVPVEKHYIQCTLWKNTTLTQLICGLVTWSTPWILQFWAFVPKMLISQQIIWS